MTVYRIKIDGQLRKEELADFEQAVAAAVPLLQVGSFAGIWVQSESGGLSWAGSVGPVPLDGEQTPLFPDGAPVRARPSQLAERL